MLAVLVILVWLMTLTGAVEIGCAGVAPYKWVKGAEVPIQCVWPSDTSNVSIKVHWYGPKGQIASPMERMEVGESLPVLTHHEIRRENQTALALHLHSIKEADSGTYECRVYHEGVLIVDSCYNLIVAQPPKAFQITTSLDPSTPVLGPLIFQAVKSLTLTCSVAADPRVSLTWFGGNDEVRETKLEATDTTIYTNLVLTTEELRHKDRTYACEASIDNFWQRTLYITPKMVTLPHQVYIGEGANYPWLGEYHNYTCTAEGGDPQPEVTWWVGNKRIFSNVTRHDTTNRVVTTALLKLMEPTTLKCTTSLLVQGGGMIYGPAATNTIRPIQAYVRIRNNGSQLAPGGRVELECLPIPPARGKFTWYLDRNGSRVNISSESTITIIYRKGPLLERTICEFTKDTGAVVTGEGYIIFRHRNQSSLITILVCTAILTVVFGTLVAIKLYRNSRRSQPYVNRSSTISDSFRWSARSTLV